MKASRLPIVSALTAILFTCTAFNVHAETQQISGTTTGGYTKQQPVPIANADGNLLIMSEYHGTNKSTSGNGYMDGASVINQEIAQLFQGNRQMEWPCHHCHERRQSRDHVQGRLGICQWYRQICRH